MKTKEQTRMTKQQKLMRSVAKATLLVMIFAIVFAGTLSGAFGIENLALENAAIDSNGNITSEFGDVSDVGVAKAATYPAWYWGKNKDKGDSTILNYTLNGDLNSYHVGMASNRDYSYIVYHSDGYSGTNGGARIHSNGHNADVWIYWTLTFRNSLYFAVKNDAISSVDFKVNLYTPSIADNTYLRVYGTEIYPNAPSGYLGSEWRDTGNSNSRDGSVSVSGNSLKSSESTVNHTYTFYPMINVWSAAHNVDTYLHSSWVDIHKNASKIVDSNVTYAYNGTGNATFNFSNSGAGIYQVYMKAGNGTETKILDCNESLETFSNNTKDAYYTTSVSAGTEYTFRIVDNIGGESTVKRIVYGVSYNKNGGSYSMNSTGNILSSNLANTSHGLTYSSGSITALQDSTITADWYLKNASYFTQWSTNANGSNPTLAVSGATGTSISSGTFGAKVKSNIDSNTLITTLYAQYALIPFSFNGKSYSAFDSSVPVLQAIEGNSGNFLSCSISGYNVSITYSSALSSSNKDVVESDYTINVSSYTTTAPNVVGDYKAYIRIYKSSENSGSTIRERGRLVLPFSIVQGDFGKLTTGASGVWGCETNPYLIENKTHLLNLANIVNGTIDPLNSVQGINGATSCQATSRSYVGCYFRITSDIAFANGEFVVIGDEDADWGGFGGTIKGYKNGNANSMVTINVGTVSLSGQWDVGFVGCMIAGGLEYIQIEGKFDVGGAGNVGGLVGVVKNGIGTITIKNCINKAEIKGTHTGAGGILGKAEKSSHGGEISHCLNYGKIEGGQEVGGIAGELASSQTQYFTVEYCYNEGEVSGWKNVGGIVGNTKASVTYCYNAGKVRRSGDSQSSLGFIYGGTTNVDLITNCIVFTGENVSTNIGSSNISSNSATQNGYFVFKVPAVEGNMSGYYAQVRLFTPARSDIFISNPTSTWNTTTETNNNKITVGDSHWQTGWNKLATENYNIQGVYVYYHFIEANNTRYLKTNFEISASNITAYNGTSVDAKFSAADYKNAFLEEDGKSSLGTPVTVELGTITVKYRVKNTGSWASLPNNFTYTGSEYELAAYDGEERLPAYVYSMWESQTSVVTGFPDRNWTNDNGTTTGSQPIIKNAGEYTIRYKLMINGAVVGDTGYSTVKKYHIDPITINNTAFFYTVAEGQVANNTRTSNGYPLNRSADSYSATPAMVYQGAGYVTDNFKIITDGTNLIWTAYATAEQAGSGKFAMEVKIGSLDFVGVGDIDIMKLSASNSNPVSIVIKLISKDSNYKIAASDNKIYYTLMYSDFGVLDGKTRNNTWGASLDNPYVISTVEHLLRLSQIVNGVAQWDSITVGAATDATYIIRNPEDPESAYGAYFVVTSDLTASTGMGFLPIGGHDGNTANGATDESKVFAGNFGTGAAGAQRTINLSIDTGSTGYAGLFGYVDGATISNITVNTVSGSSIVTTDDYAGGIVGRAKDSELVNCKAFINVAGNNYVGGMIGYAESTTIVERNGDTVLTDFRTGDVTSTANFAGGLVGYWKVTRNDQINNGYTLTYGGGGETIDGINFVGGLVGYFDGSGAGEDGGKTGLNINAKLSAGGSNIITVKGQSFVGALYGAFVGTGYKLNQVTLKPTDTIVNIQCVENDALAIHVDVIIKNNATAIGGLFGYVAKAGVYFVDNYQMLNNVAPVTFDTTDVSGRNVNFVGMIAGIIGENANLVSIDKSTYNGDTLVTTSGERNVVYITTPLGSSNKLNDYVGAVAGYVTSTAGIYRGKTGNQEITLFGNNVILVVDSATTGHDNVGGLFGAIGKLSGATDQQNRISNDLGGDWKTSAKALLKKAMETEGATNPDNIVTYGPQVADFGTNNVHGGVAANLENVTGNDYVGGIVGAVYENARLEFVNPSYGDDVATEINNHIDAPYSVTNRLESINHTPIFNGDRNGADTSTQTIINGATYVGGIVGYLSNNLHVFTRVVSRGVVGVASSTYVGGLVGYMQGGNITNSMAAVARQIGALQPNASERDAYRGSSTVGGIVGNITNGSILNCLVTGMNFSKLASTESIGPIAGEVGVTASVNSSWAYVVVDNPSYQSTPKNAYGKVILVDRSLSYGPSYAELAKAIGLYNFALTGGTNGSTNYNTAEVGFLSFRVKMPDENKQLAFYNASGSDVVTNNEFGAFASWDNANHTSSAASSMVLENSILNVRIGLFDVNEQDSMSVCAFDVQFKNISPYHGSNKNDAAAHENAEAGYRGPSNSTRYSAEVTETAYANSGDNVSKVVANIFFNGVLVGTSTENNQLVGKYSNTFTVGTASNPYIIASQRDWDDFAYNVYSGKNDYAGQYVKMTADVHISSTNSNYNTRIADFQRTSTKDYPSNTDAEYRSSNMGLNIAGNLAQGQNTVNTVTITGETQQGTKTACFKGTFDGNGHKITIYASLAAHRLSVFPNASNATILNLTIEGTINATPSSTDGSAGGYDAAAFVGKPFGKLTIYNCINKASVTAKHNAGGFVGYSNGKTLDFAACTNTGAITTYESPSFVSKTQQESQYGTGGIVGEAMNTLTVESCLNTGNITGKVNIGGIVGSAYGDVTVTVQNCANQGKIESTELQHVNVWFNDNEIVGDNIWANTGGIVGVANQQCELVVRKSYNTGKIQANGNCVGGIVGTIGSFIDWNGDEMDDNTPGTVQTSKKSEVSECYNTGSVTAGGTSPVGIPYYGQGADGFDYSGTCAGGLIGVVSSVDVSDCYNAGTITTYGGCGVFRYYDNFLGGIIGLAGPRSSTLNITVTRTYNVGELVNAESTNSGLEGCGAIIGGQRNCTDVHHTTFGAGTATFVLNNITLTNCWTKKNYLKYNGSYRNMRERTVSVVAGETFGGWICPAEGSLVNLEDMTAYYDGSSMVVESSVVSTMASNSNWFLAYGCLPQLACFALDSYNNLSMSAKGYGKDNYGEYTNTLKTVGTAEDFPYIITDGIELSSLASMTNFGRDSFDSKFIEFANGENNVLGYESKFINMPNNVTGAPDDNAYTANNGTNDFSGKSYHLFTLGSIHSTNFGSTTSLYSDWVSKNKYYSAKDGAQKSNVYLGMFNIQTIGTSSTRAFKGNISGEQADGTATTIYNLRVNGNDYSGLFGYTDGASISYIRTHGYTYTIQNSGTSYTGGVNGRGHVGGIVGYANNTTVDHCGAWWLDVYNYSSGRTGGIVGAAAGKTIISNCTFERGRIRGGGCIGVILGLAESGSTVNVLNCEVKDCERLQYNTDDSNNNVSMNDIGGIVGRSNANALTISGCQIGVNGSTVVEASWGFGGVIGGVTKNTLIMDTTVGENLLIKRNVNTTNSPTYGTAIGGFVGYSADVSDGLSVAFGGNIVFKGNIEITQSNGDVKNVGCLVGYMGNGSRFMDSANVKVVDDNPTNNTYTILITGTGARENIGGVAGCTKSATFSGTFEVSATLKVGFSTNVAYSASVTGAKTYGTNIGGFIGKNDGETAILATGTHIDIDGYIEGKENIGGFIGNNSRNGSLYIGPDTFNGMTYTGANNTLEIHINATIAAGDYNINSDTGNNGDNVGGMIGHNGDNVDNVGGMIGHNEASNGGHDGVFIQKGQIYITDKVNITGHDDVGGIIGNNSAKLEVGGSVVPNSLTIWNNGNVTGHFHVGGVFGSLNEGSISGTFRNTGDVKGINSVGGVVGLMSTNTSIYADENVSTVLINGHEAYASSSAEASVAADPGVLGTIGQGKVSGFQFVGGSVGSMQGTINGTATNRVRFVNYGTLGNVTISTDMATSAGITDRNALQYAGGNIGTLVGDVSYAEFVNASLSFSVNGLRAVGGSIGFVGQYVPEGLTGVSITNTHFEYSEGNMVIGGETPSDARGGIGGVIGIINAVRTGGWSGNTFYAQGNVEAAGHKNVGGIIGYINTTAPNIVISNTLAYQTRVVGSENVGGIVGGTYATGTQILNSFNVSGGAGTGVSGSTGINVGGIIGRALKDDGGNLVTGEGATDASTSYWVRSEVNSSLEKADINNLQKNFADIQMLTLDGGALDAEVAMPLDYFKEIYENRETNHRVTESEGAETVHDANLEQYSRIISATVNVTFGRDTVTKTGRFVSEYEIVYEYPDGRDPSLPGSGRFIITTGDKTYKYIASNNAILDIDENTEWADLLADTYENLQYNIVNENYVYISGSGFEYSTGKEQTGWFFVYASSCEATIKINGANQTVNVGAINAIHSGTGVSDLDAWKRIADAYTLAEREAGDHDRELKSLIAYGDDATEGGEVENGYVYATAQPGDYGYYLYMATSGRGENDTKILPTVNAYDNVPPYFFSVQANGAETMVKNIVVFYRKLQYKTSIVYNGYDRIAPVNDTELTGRQGTMVEDAPTFNEDGYYYIDNSSEDQVYKEAGTYTSNLEVYFRNVASDLNIVAGRDTAFTWRITKKEVVVATTSTTSGVYGQSTNKFSVTVKGYAPTDTFIVNVTIKLKNGSIATVQLTSDMLNETPATVTSNEALLTSNGITVALQKGAARDEKTYGSSGAAFTKNGAASASTYWRQMIIDFNFRDVDRYELTFDTTPELKANYNMQTKNTIVKVEPKQLTITPESDGNVFDNTSQGTIWKIAGWQTALDNEVSIKSYLDDWVGGGVVAYAQVDNGNTPTLTLSNKFGTGTLGSYIEMRGMKDVGSYTLQFVSNYKGGTHAVSVSSGKIIIGNYYFDVSGSANDYKSKKGLNNNYCASPYVIGIVKVEIGTRTDGPSSHVYDGLEGYFNVPFQVKDGSTALEITSTYQDIIKSYYSFGISVGLSSTITATAASNITWTLSGDKKTYTAKFYTGNADAATYHGRLTLTNEANQNANAKNCLPDSTEAKLDDTHVISKRTITLEYTPTDTSPFTYDTKSHGISSITIGNLVSGESVKLNVSIEARADDTLSSWTWNSSSVDVEGGKNLTNKAELKTSDAGVYNLRVNRINNGTNGKANNYQLPSNTRYSWRIDPKDVSVSAQNGSGTYDGKAKTPSLSITPSEIDSWDDHLSFNYHIKDSSDNEVDALIDAGSYTLTYSKDDFTVSRNGNANGTNNRPLIENYNVTASGTITYTIAKATLTLNWTNNTLYYNGTSQGQSVATVNYGGSTATVTNNKFNAYKPDNAASADALELNVTGHQIDAGTGYTMTATLKTTTRSSNYTLNSSSTTTTYEIKKAVVSIVAASGVTYSEPSKVYNGNASLDTGYWSISWTAVSGTYLPQTSDFTVSGHYDNKNVGAGNRIAYTITIKEGSANNIEFQGGTTSASGTIYGEITPAQVTVTLDKLRNGKATKAFDDTVYYGGQNGFVNGNSRSQVYRSGEGFVVAGFVAGDTVSITAIYQEIDGGREAFDSFINNVVKDAANNYSVDNANPHYKQLVFNLRGTDASNYTFIIKKGDGTQIATSSGGSAIVKDDRAESGSGIQVEITVNALKVNYTNTMQSYANADNSYNTDWLPVQAVVPSYVAAGVGIQVTNNWMYENNNPANAVREYHEYTVIRGRVGDSVLSARITTNDPNGKYINYSLSNQPILTIGYFVSGDEFPIASLASLMIATYYHTMFVGSTNPSFNVPVVSGATWTLIVTAANYDAEGSFEAHKPADAGECTSWDEYFAMLEAGGKYVFLNTNEGENSGWGFYTPTETEGEVKSYSSFKQVANISGIVTDADIAILNSFFTRFENGVPTAQDWGYGSTNYLKNFLKVGVGNVTTVLGSIFVDDFGTGCVYDGNGYTINHINILSMDANTAVAGNINVGMFANITSDGVVKNVHLRNFNIVVNVVGSGDSSAPTLNVGGIAGLSSMSSALENSTFHGSIAVNANGMHAVYVGGVIGRSSTSLDGIIVLGSIYVESSSAVNVGGVVGATTASFNDVVSLMEVTVKAASTSAVRTIGTSPSNNGVVYMAHSTWLNNTDVTTEGGKTFTELVKGTETITGSISGYLSSNYYCKADAAKGVYDVIDNFNSTDFGSSTAPRESMRLRDIVDVYLFMYTLSAGADYRYGSENEVTQTFQISSTSWLVGNAHGTDSSRIVIANQQGVSLLREFRFASFTLACNVEMYSTFDDSVYSGAFYGDVEANEHTITLHAPAARQLFEVEVTTLPYTVITEA